MMRYFSEEQEVEKKKNESAKLDVLDFEGMQTYLQTLYGSSESDLPRNHFSSATLQMNGANQCGSLYGNEINDVNLSTNAYRYASEESSNANGEQQKEKEHKRQLVQRGKLTSVALENIHKTGYSNPEVTTVTCDGTPYSILKFGKLKKLDPEQRTAFSILTACFVLTYYDEAYCSSLEDMSRPVKEDYYFITKRLRQIASLHGNNGYLRLFMTGRAGSGKSSVINAVVEYCAKFCKEIGVEFSRYSIRKTALSGAAAMEIGGETLHSALKLNSQITDEVIKEHAELWRDTRLLIIDEISMADYYMLKKINDNLQSFTDCRTRNYGRVHVVFSGDFRQLEPIGKSNSMIYKKYDELLWLPELTSFIELMGIYRFEKDPEWGELLGRIYNGEDRKEDRETINRRLMDLTDPNFVSTFDNNITFAVYANKDRSAINACRFSKHLEKHFVKHGFTANPPTGYCAPMHTLIVLADMIDGETDKEVPQIYASQIYNSKHDNSFWVGSDTTNKEAMDPFLRLYTNTRIMLTNNADVSSGKANGTTCIFKEAVLKEGAKVSLICVDGYWVNAVKVSQVKHLVCFFDKCAFLGQFTIEPTKLKLKTQVSVDFANGKKNVAWGIKYQYFQCVLNDATTGHKLQGKTLETLAVAAWSLTRNWAYVVLSRVKEMANLSLRLPLPKKIDFSLPDKLREMLAILKEKKSVPNIDETFRFD